MVTSQWLKAGMAAGSWPSTVAAVLFPENALLIPQNRLMRK